MLSIVNEVDPLIFPLHMFCMQYKHVFFQKYGSSMRQAPGRPPTLGKYHRDLFTRASKIEPHVIISRHE